MKRTVTVLLVLILALSLAACGSKPADPNTGNTPGSSQPAPGNSQPAPGNSQPAPGSDQPDSSAALSEDQLGTVPSEDPSMTLFRVSRAFPLEETAWLGLCPVGSYVNEADADEVDVYYSYARTRETKDADYLFEFHFSDIEPGNYTMVLCDNDDEGLVLFRIPLALKSNGSFSLDYANAWVRK